MSMPLNQLKDSLQTPQRAKLEGLEDPQQFLWAISYSDLLMVLMSFFIIFFEMSETSPASPMKDVILALKSTIQTQAAASSGTGTGSGGATTGSGGEVGADALVTSRAPAARVSFEELVTNLGLNHWKPVKDPLTGGILLHFPDSVFKAGQYEIKGRVEHELNRVLGLLKPHSTKINLTLIGHTDTQPVQKSRDKVVDSNMILSNLRAGRAVEYAIKQGYDPASMTSQGMGQYSRNTRSLSLRITERTHQEAGHEVR